MNPTPYTDVAGNLAHFAGLRLGVMVTFGLHSLLGRGEWVLNREQIPVDEYVTLADRFTAAGFDADDLARRVKAAGAAYIVLITMHHDGFALYDSAINPFNSVGTACGRDLVAEVVAACRRHGLRIHLYHSLNHWTAHPDGVTALQDDASGKVRRAFVDFAHARLRELVTRFNPIDCVWYDGWWPFDAEGWRAREMNESLRAIQPHLIFNGRNGLAGDFATPEQHLSAPKPWRPWEACVTHNNNWGLHRGDQHHKSDAQVIDMLTECAAGAGNLLVNVGPDERGTLPAPTIRLLDSLGQWLAVNGDAIRGSEPFTFNLMQRGDHRGDWSHHGRYTAKANTLYLHLFNWPGDTVTLAGLEGRARNARLLGHDAQLRHHQSHTRLTITGLPPNPPHPLGAVLAIDCDAPPTLYLTGGLLPPPPHVPHPRYDPCPSDLPT